MLKQAYEVVTQILTSATHRVRTLVGLVRAEKQVIDQALPDAREKSSRSRSKSDGCISLPSLEPAMPGRPTHRVITVASGDNLVNLKLPREYQFGYDWVQSECGNLLHVNAKYCPSSPSTQTQDTPKKNVGRAKKIWNRVRSWSVPGREDHTPFKSTKQKILQRECQLVIHLPTETFAFVESHTGVRVEKMTAKSGKLRLHGKEQSDKNVVLTADLTQFQPLVQLSKTTPPELKSPRVSIAHAVGKTLGSPKTQCVDVAPKSALRGIWHEAHNTSRFSIFSWTKALP